MVEAEPEIDPELIEANSAAWKLFTVIELLNKHQALSDFYDYSILFYDELVNITVDRKHNLNQLLTIVASVKPYSSWVQQIIPATLKEFLETDHKYVIFTIKTGEYQDQAKPDSPLSLKTTVFQIPISRKKSVLNYGVVKPRGRQPGMFELSIRSFDIIVSRIRFDVIQENTHIAIREIVEQFGEFETNQLPIRLAHSKW
jgi:hypothetical protein